MEAAVWTQQHGSGHAAGRGGSKAAGWAQGPALRSRAAALLRPTYVAVLHDPSHVHALEPRPAENGGAAWVWECKGTEFSEMLQPRLRGR